MVDIASTLQPPKLLGHCMHQTIHFIPSSRVELLKPQLNSHFQEVGRERILIVDLRRATRWNLTNCSPIFRSCFGSIEVRARIWGKLDEQGTFRHHLDHLANHPSRFIFPLSLQQNRSSRKVFTMDELPIETSLNHVSCREGLEQLIDRPDHVRSPLLLVWLIYCTIWPRQKSIQHHCAKEIESFSLQFCGSDGSKRWKGQSWLYRVRPWLVQRERLHWLWYPVAERWNSVWLLDMDSKDVINPNNAMRSRMEARYDFDSFHNHPHLNCGWLAFISEDRQESIEENPKVA